MQNKHFIYLFIALILPFSSSSNLRFYKHLGCYNDDYYDPALPDLLDGDVKTVDECANLARKKGFTTFAVQYTYNNYECYSGANAYKTYDKHKKASSCINGMGGYYVNDVYQFTDEPLWPEGKYSVIKPSSGCPFGWTENGYLFQDTLDTKAVTNNKSSPCHIEGSVSKRYVIRWFCLKTQRTTPKWPQGQYCIYREGNTDPKNMQKGWMKMYTERVFAALQSKTGIYSYSSSSSKWYTSRFYVYCQTTGVKSVPIDLPISQPFYLLPYGSPECQQVKWMVATKEWIRYGTNNNGGISWKSGTIPYVKVGTKTRPGITVYYCYYQSCNRTLNDTKGVFQTPRYPENYPDGQLCSWRVLVPVNHTLIVRVTHFSLYNDYTKDTDVLEVYRLTNKKFERNGTYKGFLQPFSLQSSSDLLLVFRSNGALNDVGFHAEYTVFNVFQETTTGSPTTTIKSRPSTSVKPTTISTGTPISSEKPITEQSSTKEPIHPLTGLRESTTQEPTSTTEVVESTNKTVPQRDALKDGSEGTGTAILIVIPLVCFILIVVVGIDIYCRWKLNYRKKSKKEDYRITDDPAEQVANNPTYGRPDDIPMAHFNEASTANTRVQTRNDYEDTDKSYDRLSRVPPKHQVPEQYQGLNTSSYPSTQNRTSIQDNGPTENMYQVLESPTSSGPACDDDMYHTIDAGSCSNNVLYERAILYDSVA